METPPTQPETIRIALTPDFQGKLVRDRFITNMISSGEQPDFEYLKTPKQIAWALRRKLEEEVEEMAAAGSISAMVNEAADFLSVATAFHNQVNALPADSFIFGRFQSLVDSWDLSMNDIEIRRRERDNELGVFACKALVRSVLIAPDNPRRQYYLDNPRRFPVIDHSPPDAA